MLNCSDFIVQKSSFFIGLFRSILWLSLIWRNLFEISYKVLIVIYDEVLFLILTKSPKYNRLELLNKDYYSPKKYIMKKLLKKSIEIFLFMLIALIPMGYVFGVVRTEILVHDSCKGLPLVIGFIMFPLMLTFTAFLCYTCVTSLTKIGEKVHSWRHGWREWSVVDGIVCFIITLLPSMLLVCGTVYTFLEVTGITKFGMFS